MLTREQFLTLPAPRIEKVQMLGSEEFVYLRELNAGDFDRWQESNMQLKGAQVDKITLADSRAKLLVRAICDESGNRLLRDDDMEAISRMPTRQIQHLYDVASRLNAITSDDVEQIEKN